MGARRPHAVVVDNDPHILALLADLLAEGGWRVTPLPAPPDGPAGLAALGPDLLLTDLGVDGDGGDGLGYLAALRADPRTRDVPVVLCSAVRAEALAAAATGSGGQVRAAVAKPFAIDDLLAAVAGALEGP